MLRRTHLALGLAVGFYFLPHMRTNSLIFLGAVIIATMLPDIENGFAAAKRTKLFSFKSTQWAFHKNRLLHTYTFLVPATIVVAILYPPISFPFFLGYSFHIFLDSFSPEGIRPFWPLKGKSTGSISPGGKIDKILFYVFVILDFALFIKLFI